MPYCCNSQQLYLGINTYSSQDADIEATFEIREDWARIQVSYLTNLISESRINLKFGVRPIKFNNKDLEMWFYLPYLNGRIWAGDKGGYNTPINVFQIQYKNSITLTTDVFRNKPVVVFGIRKIF